MKHFNLYSYVKQNCRVKTIVKKDNVWTINTDNEIYHTTNLVIATGTVNDCPNIPDDDFYNNFTGDKYHSNEFEKVINIKNKKILHQPKRKMRHFSFWWRPPTDRKLIQSISFLFVRCNCWW